MITAVPPTHTAGNTPSGDRPAPTPSLAPRPRHPLLALIHKEFHQNLAFAALVIVVDVIVLLMLSYTATGDRLFENVLLLPTAHTAIPVGCAIAGLCLGLLQPYFDRNFDTWAFLVHRPVPRALLFRGRAIAGLLLYGLVAGLPLLAILILATSPYGQGLFLWNYTLPPIADFIAGIPFYLAGLLAADRSARLYASRAVPILFAVLSAIGAGSVPWFWLSIFISCAAASLLWIAAQGSVISHGYTLSAPRAARVATLAVLLFSFSLLLSPVTGMLRTYGEIRYSQAFRQPSLITTAYTATSHVLLEDATIATLTSEMKRDPTNWRPEEFTPSAQHFTDLAGHPIPNAHLADDQKHLLSFTFVDPAAYAGRNSLPTYRDLAEFADRLETQSPVPHEESIWYWIRQQRLFILYRRALDANSIPVGPHHFVGSFGSNGFIEGARDAAPFPPGTVFRPGLPFIRTPHTLFVLNTRQRTLTTLLTTPADETLLQAMLIGSETDKADTRDLVVISNRWLYHLTQAGTLLHRVPITGDLTHDHLTVTEFPALHKWVLTYHRFWWPEPDRSLRPSLPNQSYKSFPTTWETYDDAGQKRASITFPAIEVDSPPIEYTMPAPDGSQIATAGVTIGAAIALSNPILESLNDLLGHLSRPYDHPEPHTSLTDLLPLPRVLATTLALLLACAALAYVLAIVYRLPHPTGWSLLALLTLLAANTLPRRIRCPACPHKRPLDQPLCPHCHTPFPPPPTTGTEIFTPIP